jgi:hypothetical protein
MSIQFLFKISYEQLKNALSPRRKLLAELRAKWGKQTVKYSWLTSHYFDLVRDESFETCVDDKTWVDLEFPAIFSRLDSTVTTLGSQVLFKRLREYVKDPGELATQYAVYEELRSNALLREEIQLKLAGLRNKSDDQSAANDQIAGLIFDAVPDLPKHSRWLSLWGLVSVTVLVAAITLPWSAWKWFAVIAVIAVNIIILSRYFSHVAREIEVLKSCLHMLDVADGLASMHLRHPLVPQLTRLFEETALRAEIRKALRWVSIAKLSIISYLIPWLNLAFLVELIVYVDAANKFYRIRSKLAPTFEAVGSLDAAIAIASYLEQCQDHCRPAIVGRPFLHIRDGYHPLIVDPVKNTISLDQRSALVTGSNMAGKTTFIKMIGINIILSRTLGFCLASAATMPQATVLASIQSDHSVASGKSHFFSEIQTIRSFIAPSRRDGFKVFVIDELFSGTNTIERVAVARAVLETICRDALVLVTTHDVELQAFLTRHYDLYHFQEEPDVEGFFDYRLRPGAATERNAIRLLERMGFPDEVIANAMTYAGRSQTQNATSVAE